MPASRVLFMYIPGRKLLKFCSAVLLVSYVFYKRTATPPRFMSHSMLRTALARHTKFCLLHPVLKPLGSVSGKTTDDQTWVEGSGQV